MQELSEEIDGKIPQDHMLLMFGVFDRNVVFGSEQKRSNAPVNKEKHEIIKVSVYHHKT